MELGFISEPTGVLWSVYGFAPFVLNIIANCHAFTVGA